ncbi:MAG: hypothetical protein AABN34_04650 [Acidobacteriota bacterium]
MAKRLLLTAVCLLVLPILNSPSGASGQKGAVAFQSVALAGHVIVGGWCDCGTPGCICDPGEVPVGQRAMPVSDQANDSLNPGAIPIPEALPDLDFGSGALLLALAFFLWTRLRA